MFKVHIEVRNGIGDKVLDFIATNIQTIGPANGRQLHFMKVLPDGKRELYAVYMDRIKLLRLEAE